MRKLWFAIAAAVAIAAPRPGEAQSTLQELARTPAAHDGKVFAAVDAVTVMGQRVIVTGVVQGEATASSWAVTFSSVGGDAVGWTAMCQRSALLALAKPGQYLLELHQASNGASACKLTRVNP